MYLSLIKDVIINTVQIMRGVFVVSTPKPSKSKRPPPDLCSVFLIRFSKGLSMSTLNPLLIHCSLLSRQDFSKGNLLIRQDFNKGSDQAALLTQNIEDSFEAKRKVSAMFENLIVAYNTVWHHVCTYNLLRLLPHKHMIQMIMELIQNSSFTLTTKSRKTKQVMTSDK